MFFRIHHRLSYRYDRPVFLEPMTLRLTPRQDGSQRILEHHLQLVDPAAGLTRVLEPDGTDAMVAWFQQEQDQLTIEVDMLLETLRSNPYDWIVTHREAQHLPVDYPEAEACSLAGCRHGQIDPAVRAWAQAIADKVEGSATAFLGALADEIHHGFHHVGRLEGEPTSAAETLATLTGACRDTAVLYIAACRSQGLAARFVSGYSMHHPPEVSEHELHAWAEVYLPGGGWRGFDPSLGLAVADGHVVLAAAPDHHLAAPVSGRYRGTGVGSSLAYLIRLQAASSREELEGTAQPMVSS
ncbi:transglutaminase family protein [Cyanobium sp. AMD-g]|uniref:transglutaminase family protein n=1 Tax=Cyanobium sp. AMD-g TaxID=2823699 RepID=UPI0020CCD8F0|nr:transglutaminase family protein [Cyanobium sp. AMD-g]MCP9931846.1 transglutaminase family protein [Cyanobium sp. AMD-g]